MNTVMMGTVKKLKDQYHNIDPVEVNRDEYNNKENSSVNFNNPLSKGKEKSSTKVNPETEAKRGIIKRG